MGGNQSKTLPIPTHHQSATGQISPPMPTGGRARPGACRNTRGAQRQNLAHYEKLDGADSKEGQVWTTHPQAQESSSAAREKRQEGEEKEAKTSPIKGCVGMNSGVKRKRGDKLKKGGQRGIGKGNAWFWDPALKIAEGSAKIQKRAGGPRKGLRRIAKSSFPGGHVGGFRTVDTGCCERSATNLEGEKMSSWLGGDFWGGQILQLLCGVVQKGISNDRQNVQGGSLRINGSKGVKTKGIYRRRRWYREGAGLRKI